MAGVAAYHNSFAGPCVFDDVPWIVENPSIRSLWPIGHLLAPQSARDVGGRPVVSLTLAVNYALGGTDVWGYHAVNLAIHILAAWTLLGVTRRTLLSPRLQERFGSAATPLALMVAILWTVHPLQTEAVTYLIQRTEALVGLLYLLTLYCVIRGATSSRATRWYSAAVAASLLGMATKELMATAPVIVLLYDRTFLAGSFREALRRRYGLYLALAATWGVVVATVDLDRIPRRNDWLCRAEVHLVVVPVDAARRNYSLPSPGDLADETLLGLRLARGAERGRGRFYRGSWSLGLLGLTVWALVKRPAWGFLGGLVLRDPCAHVELRAHPGRGFRAPHVFVAGGGGGGLGGWWMVGGPVVGAPQADFAARSTVGGRRPCHLCRSHSH